MDIYAELKKQINEDLQSSIINLLNKHEFPYNLHSERSEENFYVTFFVINNDYNSKQKKLSKRQLAHPNVDIAYTAHPSFDYDEALKHALSNLKWLYFAISDTECCRAISSKVTAWSKTLLGALSVKYEEKYGIKLVRMPIEFYMPDNPKDMFISKIPEFEDLAFVENNSKQKKLIQGSDFIVKQAQIIADAQNLRYKDLPKPENK